MGNSLTNSLSGLRAAERSIATSSHNIANANTDGYTRQRTINASNRPQPVSSGFQGTGVRTESIQRIHDQIAESRLLSATTELNRIGSMSQMSERLNTLFSEEISGLNSAQIDFFNALEEAGNNPHSNAPAQHAIATASTLASRFNFVGDQLSSIQQEVNSSIKDTISQVNNLANSIYSINQEISTLASADPENPPNDLLDQRDQLLQQLSEHVNVDIRNRDRFGIDVTLGNGLPLVTIAGATVLHTDTDPSDPGKLTFSLQTRTGQHPIADPPGGGILGGLLEFNQQVLDPIRNDIGRMASVLAFNTNTAFRTGTSPDAAFFEPGEISSFAKTSNQGTASVTATMIDPDSTTSSSYRMSYDGSEYTLTRLSDNTQLTGTGDMLMDGIQFSSNGDAVAGDSFLIEPFAMATSKFSIATPDPVSLGNMVGNTDQQLVPVAQSMASLRQSVMFGNESATLTEQYARIVSQVGTAANAAGVQLQTMQNIMQETQTHHDQISAVSLDEEAANLIKYQQAYEAAARVMVVSGTLFDTLLGTLNRI